MLSFHYKKKPNLYKNITYIAVPLLIIYIAVIYRYTNHSLDIYPVRYHVSLAEGIDFSRDGYPTFIDKVFGFSARESWGRWTNQYRGEVQIIYKHPLPKNFTLSIDAIAFDINGNWPTIIKVGDQSKEVLISSEKFSIYTVDFLNVSNSNTIEMIPSHPISPAQIDIANKDGRLLGIGLRSMRVVNNEIK
jgi:phosphoglycerol transferase